MREILKVISTLCKISWLFLTNPKYYGGLGGGGGNLKTETFQILERGGVGGKKKKFFFGRFLIMK